MKTILFDLDGTLLKMDEKEFERVYFKSLWESCKEYISLDDLIFKVWAATRAMVVDVGDQTNETVFYRHFEELLGTELFQQVAPLIEAYYDTGFDQTKAVCQPQTPLIEAARLLKSQGARIILATNPIFPETAINKRIAWTGLSVDFFDHITYFEESTACKPQSKYYQEIIERTGINPAESMMVGNNDLEDLVAGKLGLKTYLVENCLITNEKRMAADLQGTAADFLELVKVGLI